MFKNHVKKYLLRTVTEVEERIFYSTGLSYTLKWVRNRHINSLPTSLGQNLLKYYNFLCSNEYPEEVFKDKNITRCSSFKIKYLKRNARKKISLNLVKYGIVQLINQRNRPSGVSEDILKLPEMAKVWHKIYSATMEDSVGHDPVLSKILELNNSALATEISVWSSPREFLRRGTIPDSNFKCKARDLFTGHIDLLLYDNELQKLIVADYKPENMFLKSLPQVAIYGLMMKKILNIKSLKCLSFSRRKAWLYDPEILRTEIPRYIRRNGNPKLYWQWILTGLKKY